MVFSGWKALEGNSVAEGLYSAEKIHFVSEKHISKLCPIL
jgi:hypothetical protein